MPLGVCGRASLFEWNGFNAAQAYWKRKQQRNYVHSVLNEEVSDRQIAFAQHQVILSFFFNIIFIDRQMLNHRSTVSVVESTVINENYDTINLLYVTIHQTKMRTNQNASMEIYLKFLQSIN